METKGIKRSSWCSRTESVLTFECILNKSLSKSPQMLSQNYAKWLCKNCSSKIFTEAAQPVRSAHFCQLLRHGEHEGWFERMVAVHLWL